jgi:16S rRNA processing protein RimM
MAVSGPLVPLAEITTTHGLDGWLKARLYNPETTLFSRLDRVYLEKNQTHVEREIEASKPYKGQLLIKFREIAGIDEARNWIGWTICAPEAALPVLAQGEYYNYQAVGLEVFDLEGNHIGTVARTWSTAGGELYVVQGADREYLIPAVKDIIEKIDLAEGKMIINPPEGLLDL